MKFLSILCAGALALVSGAASAAVVYDNGLPNTSNGYSIAGGNVTRDNFSLGTSADITGVTFYFQNYNGITGWNQDISYQFSSDVGGSNILASGTGQNVTPTDSGLPWCCAGGNAWRVDFQLESAFTAVAGTTYWLGLTGATGASAAWWVTTNYVDGSNRGGVDFAFALNDNLSISPVPLPAGMPLLIGALGMAALVRRRRKTAA
jgi:hypothetical protein